MMRFKIRSDETPVILSVTEQDAIALYKILVRSDLIKFANGKYVRDGKLDFEITKLDESEVFDAIPQCIQLDVTTKTSNGIKVMSDISLTDNLYDENGKEMEIRNIHTYEKETE